MTELTIQAVFRDGAFVPTTRCQLPENATVQLVVRAGVVEPPTISDPEERRRRLSQLTRRMQDNPLPEAAPTFSRDELQRR